FRPPLVVMPALDAGIHVSRKDMDGRVIGEQSGAVLRTAEHYRSERPQLSRPAWTIAARTSERELSTTGTTGRRIVSAHFPSSDSAYFTGAGLVSTKRCECSGNSLSCSVSAVA